MKTSQKKHNIKRYGALLLSVMATPLMIHQAQALPQSNNVAIITTPSVVNGGTLPTIGAAYAGFSFFNLSNSGPANFATALAPGGVCGPAGCDTAVLNAASTTSIRCNLNILTTTQKADLVSFVNNGGKMIMYDSECHTQDYSWLPYPFVTNNPGAQGARGTLTIVEENGLSTTPPADPKFIDTNILATQTDAIGDMNVMITLDANWCLDMSGTNITPLTGPVHTYARYGNGLLIYNGMDVDYLGSSTQPSTATGAGNLAKIWLQELEVPFNPTPANVLPCGSTVVGINLTPPLAINDLALGEDSHTVTASLEDLLGNPQAGIEVIFTVVSGPNAGALGDCSVNLDCTTDANGEVSFTYDSDGSEGTDNIEACFLNARQQTICSQLVEKEWVIGGGPQALVCDADADNDVDKADLAIISRSRGQQATLGDPRDADGDGIITMSDVKLCIPECTLPQCTVQ